MNCSAIRITIAIARTEGMIDRATKIVPREEIFAQSGLQFMQFNTLYQLLAMRLANSPLLEAAESLLMMPDLFHWLLTGVKANEFTDATTTQFFDPRRKRLGDGPAGAIRAADAHSRRSDPARHDARAAAADGGRSNRLNERQSRRCRARTTRPAP